MDPTFPAAPASASASLRRQLCILTVRSPMGNEEERRLNGPKISVGAATDNDIVVEDATASRHHCEIALERDRYLVRDLDSRNGTFVNGVRVREAYLESGATLVVGQTELRFATQDENLPLAASERESVGGIVGRSRAMREVFAALERVAETEATVVIEGETGTGKEVVARALHETGPRRSMPFVVVDCAAIPSNLIESELFGHARGAFTGAAVARKGLFQHADGGTLFLDELGELDLELQPKLLRAIERREVRRVGSNDPEPVEVRLVAATHRDLESMVEQGEFRADLYYRLSVVRLSLPPLRERKEDIELLAAHFMEHGRFNRRPEGGLRVTSLHADTLAILQCHDWPGNVRELLNVVERGCSFAEDGALRPENLPAYVRRGAVVGRRKETDATTVEKLQPRPDSPPTFREAKEQWLSSFERDYLIALLRRSRGNISQAAREADMDRKHFRRLMLRHGVEVDDVIG